MLPIRVHAPEPPTPPTDDPIIPSPSPPLIRSPVSLRTVTGLVPRPIRIQVNRRTAIRTLTPLPTASRISSYWRPVDSRPANGQPRMNGRLL